jgi:glutaredoxin
MKYGAMLSLALVLAAQPALADSYRWLDEKGRVNYSDTSPPPNARNVQVLKKSGDKRDVVPAEAPGKDAKPPVTLYTSNCGAPCDQAKALLDQRTIPYTIKDASDPAIATEVKKLSGAQEVPVLTIGGNVHKGFERTLWNNLLDAAGHRAPAKEPAAKPKP